MFDNEPAAVTAAIRSGSLQQVQAEPRYQPSSRSASAAPPGRERQAGGDFVRR